MFNPMISYMIATHLDMEEDARKLFTKIEDIEDVEILRKELSDSEISHLVMSFMLLEKILYDLQNNKYVSIGLVDYKVTYNDGRE